MPSFFVKTYLNVQKDRLKTSLCYIFRETGLLRRTDVIRRTEKEREEIQHESVYINYVSRRLYLRIRNRDGADTVWSAR